MVRDLEFFVPGDRSAAEGAVDRGMALLENRVIARAKIDGVVPVDSPLMYDTGAVQVDCVVSATHGNLAVVLDRDAVIARSGPNSAVLTDQDFVIAMAQ